MNFFQRLRYSPIAVCPIFVITNWLKSSYKCKLGMHKITSAYSGVMVKCTRPYCNYTASNRDRLYYKNGKFEKSR